MIVLKATQQIFNELNGYTNGVSMLQFATDKNGNYIVGESVLNDDAYIEIRPILSGLERIQFVPQIITE